MAKQVNPVKVARKPPNALRGKSKGIGAKTKVSAHEVALWVDKHLEIPIFSHVGVNQLEKWNRFKKERGL